MKKVLFALVVISCATFALSLTGHKVAEQQPVGYSSAQLIAEQQPVGYLVTTH